MHPQPDRLGEIAAIHQGVGEDRATLLGGYRDDELRLFVDLFEWMLDLSRRQAARVRGLSRG